ncbi:MAG: sulfurtransferase complex subunit TusB [Marinosulfonomonas sp.]|nr:MAG: sulfurtransferase complex subunit TusB [Marinosulfonomonas sp.]
MGTLHTVNKSPFATGALLSCLAHAKDGDTVLMIEDGVYGASSGTKVSDVLAARSGAVTLCVLGPDFAARGLNNARLLDGIKSVDYAGFVELAADCDRTQAWL